MPPVFVARYYALSFACFEGNKHRSFSAKSTLSFACFEVVVLPSRVNDPALSFACFEDMYHVFLYVAICALSFACFEAFSDYAELAIRITLSFACFEEAGGAGAQDSAALLVLLVLKGQPRNRVCI